MNDMNTKTVLIVGATGYIGRAVVTEAVQQGYDVTVVTRSQSDDQFDGAKIIVADVANPASIAKAFEKKIDVVISCLACRSGLPQDFYDIDYKATLNVLKTAQENGAGKFILLSAICVRKPDLPLQLAKLKMEDELIRSGIDYTIVRPTAYFWVFDTQTKMIRKGKPGFLIGSGEQATHNPIAKEDLAEFLVDSIANGERRDRIFVIGGPEVSDNIITYKECLSMVFESMGKEPKLVSIPEWVIKTVIHLTGVAGIFSRKAGLFSQRMKTTVYYLENDMRAPGVGSRTFRQHMMDTTREIEM